MRDRSVALEFATGRLFHCSTEILMLERFNTTPLDWLPVETLTPSWSEADRKAAFALFGPTGLETLANSLRGTFADYRRECPGYELEGFLDFVAANADPEHAPGDALGLAALYERKARALRSMGCR